jgi:SAM-dependent methyltransferase
LKSPLRCVGAGFLLRSTFGGVKSLIAFFTRFVPRHWLQPITRWTVVLVAFVWRGNRFEDPITGRTYRKLLPYGRISPRLNAIAPHSLSLERHRAVWIYLREQTSFFTEPLRFLHLAPEYCYLRYFKRLRNLDYITGDLNSPWAEHHFDCHAIPFPDASFDVVMANHLLEHVADDRQVMREFFRVLRPGGWGIVLVPINGQNPDTAEDPAVIDPAERERLYWQRDHVRLYGYADYPQRWRDTGFEVDVVDLTKLVGEDRCQRYALGWDRTLYVIRKPR